MRLRSRSWWKPLEEQAKQPKERGMLKLLVDGLKATASLAPAAVKIYEHIERLLPK